MADPRWHMLTISTSLFDVMIDMYQTFWKVLHTASVISPASSSVVQPATQT